MKKYFSQQEVEYMNPELDQKIRDFINCNIINWEESADSETEGEALQYFGESISLHPDYRVYPDATITIVVEGERSHFDFEWEEDAEDYDDEQSGRPSETKHGNFLDYINGTIDFSFNDKAESGNNDFWINGYANVVEVEDEIIALFKQNK